MSALTNVVLNYRGFGQVESLSRNLVKRGEHVTMLSDTHTGINDNECYHQLKRCTDLFEMSDVKRSLIEISNRSRIKSVINATDFLTYVHHNLLSDYPDLQEYKGWILNARIKAECRELLNQAGVSVVRYLRISDGQLSLDEAQRKVGYPCVIKPAGGQGSDSVFKVANADQLKFYFDKIRKQTLENLNPSSSDQISVNGRIYNLSTDIILEEYLPGDEFTIDGYVSNGVPVVVAVHGKYFGSEDDGFRDRFYLSPPKGWNSEFKSKFVKFTQDVVSVLKMNKCLFHIEARLVNDELKVIEVNPRIGGGTIAENVLLSTGVSLMDVYADMLVNKSIPVDPVADGKTIFDFAVTLEKTGKIKSIHGVDRIRSMPQVRDVAVYIKEGQVIEHLIGERFALVCNGLAKDQDQAFEVYQQVEKMFQVEMEEV